MSDSAHRHPRAATSGHTVAVPQRLFADYRSSSGLDTRLVMLAAPYRRLAPSAETLPALLLEVEHLFVGTDFTGHQAERLLELFERLERPVVLRRRVARTGSFELMSAPTRAVALEAVRRAWARSWVEAQLTAGNSFDPGSDLQLVAAASLNAVERGELDVPAARLPDGASVDLTPQALRQLLERYLDQSGFTANAATAGTARYPAAAAIAPVLARYALGACHQRIMRPADPYAFLALLQPSHSDSATAELRSAFLERAAAVGDYSAAELLPLAEQACEAERDRSRSGTGQLDTEPADRTAAADAVVGRLSAQQLTGIGAAAGAVRGVAVRAGAPISVGAEPLVLVCEKCTVGALQSGRAVAAVVERTGTRLGLGTLLARSLGIPCVTAVHDAALISAGDRVVVDGDLGLVTLSEGAA